MEIAKYLLECGGEKLLQLSVMVSNSVEYCILMSYPAGAHVKRVSTHDHTYVCGSADQFVYAMKNKQIDLANGWWTHTNTLKRSCLCVDSFVVHYQQRSCLVVRTNRTLTQSTNLLVHDSFWESMLSSGIFGTVFDWCFVYITTGTLLQRHSLILQISVMFTWLIKSVWVPMHHTTVHCDQVSFEICVSYWFLLHCKVLQFSTAVSLFIVNMPSVQG